MKHQKIVWYAWNSKLFDYNLPLEQKQCVCMYVEGCVLELADITCEIHGSTLSPPLHYDNDIFIVL